MELIQQTSRIVEDILYLFGYRGFLLIKLLMTLEDEKYYELESFNPFVMETIAPYSLNYLIFMQNIYLNKTNDKLYFPYLNTSEWGLLSNIKFLIQYKEIWDIAIKKNASNRLYDHNGILDVDTELFKRLFECNEKGDYGFNESKKSFLAWWDGIYGKIAIQSVINEDITTKLYNDLSLSIEN